MPKINLWIETKSAKELNKQQLIGFKDENIISYYEANFLINIVIEKTKIILTKQNNEYKITINLAKDNSYGVYEDLQTGQGLKMRVSEEIVDLSNNQIYLKYIVENLNTVEYLVQYEVE